MAKWIIGFAHTGTTYVYKLSKEVNKALKHWFEPFNLDVASTYLVDGRHTHYSEGEVESDHGEAPVEARLIALEVGIIYWRAMSCQADPKSVMDRIAKFDKLLGDNWVVKDVSSWPLIWELAKRDKIDPRNTIVVVRNWDDVWRDFKRFLSIESTARRLGTDFVRYTCNLAGLGLYAMELGQNPEKHVKSIKIGGRRIAIGGLKDLFNWLVSIYLRFVHELEGLGAKIVKVEESREMVMRLIALVGK